jgi:hypothetical protein
MKRQTYYSIFICSILIVTLVLLGFSNYALAGGKYGKYGKYGHKYKHAPRFRVDPFWPKALPNDWILGQVAGIAVDKYDRIWVVQRPRSLTVDEAGADPTFQDEDGNFINDPPRAECCFPAPSVIQYDSRGNMIQAWGGPDWGEVLDEFGRSMMEDPMGTGEIIPWIDNEHGIFVDHNMNVWLAGNAGTDTRVLKFSRTGKLLLVIGKYRDNGGSDIVDPNCSFDTLYRAADTEVDPKTNEVYIADGYGNNRVIVFDAETGEYKRHWFADGITNCAEIVGVLQPDYPDNVTPYSNPVHAVRIAKDGLVYVADRPGTRIQVFNKYKYGQPGFFVDEIFIRPATGGPGSTWDLEVSHDRRQRYLYNADGTNQYIDILYRKPLVYIYHFGRSGRNAGEFHWVHNLAVDSKGNMYTAEVDTGKRAQKFKFIGYGRYDDHKW